MKKTFLTLAAAASVLLSGCAFDRLSGGLKTLLGKDIHVAVAKLGYPDDERVILGDKVYVWSTNRMTVMPIYTTSTTSGTVGSTPYYGTTMTPSYVPVNANCKIQLTTDSDGIITRYQVEGNESGCSAYASGFPR